MFLRRSSGKIRIIRDVQILNTLFDIFFNAEHKLCICGNTRLLSLLLSYDLTKKAISVANNKGSSRQYIFEIKKENLHLCKELIKMDCEIRHSDEVEANFVVNEKEYLGAITLKEPHQQAIYSNVLEIVVQQHYIFETLWNKSILAKEKIKEIEEGIEAEFYKVITDSEKLKQIFIDLAKSIEKEALLLFASGKAMLRTDKIGAIDYLVQASSKKGATIRIICPLSPDNTKVVKRILEDAPRIETLTSVSSTYSGLFIADGAKFMRFELKEPQAEEFVEAIGFGVYSNSKTGVESSKSFFELLWNESIQQEKLKEYEKLKEAERLQREFINVAAHELRTPIQPILGLTEVLRSQIKDAKQVELLDIVRRNAKRLQQLADDILDVTKIESQTLRLRKELVNLHDIIAGCIEDARTTINRDNKKANEKTTTTTITLSTSAIRTSNIEIHYEPKEQNIIVEADRAKISQVVTNLLSNAIKFAKPQSEEEEEEEEENKKVNKEQIKEEVNIEEEEENQIISVIVEKRKNVNTTHNHYQPQKYPRTEAGKGKGQRGGEEEDGSYNNDNHNHRKNDSIDYEYDDDDVDEDEDDEYVIVSIKDSGQGIDPEILPQLFTKFASKSFQGTGLGLFISKSIIEAHGGKIWAKNNPDGRGATFSFSLPLAKSLLMQSSSKTKEGL